MSYKIISTEHFKQQVRMLQKDYPNIRYDLQELHRMLVEDPKCGKSLGKKVYKIRLRNSDTAKGNEAAIG